MGDKWLNMFCIKECCVDLSMSQNDIIYIGVHSNIIQTFFIFCKSVHWFFFV